MSHGTLLQTASSFADALRSHRVRNHRLLVVLSGSQGDCRARAESLVRSVGDPFPATFAEGITPRASRLLGSGLIAACYDAHPGFDPNEFATIAGMVRGGGYLLLLLPSHRLDHNADRFLARFGTARHALPEAQPFMDRLERLLEAELAMSWQGDSAPEALPDPMVPADGPTPDQAAALTVVQQQLGVATPVPLLVSAHRGRGKSALLGMIALRASGLGLKVQLTAPRRTATDEVYRFAGDATLPFLSPDELIRQVPPADLLLVDEAAGIPVPLLTRLLARYPRAIFATTEHGYEGSGRGFTLRFRAHLDRVAPGWREIPLRAPVRWADNDPLESTINRLLLLDAEPPVLPQAVAAAAAYYRMEEVARSELAADENALGQLFGLLVAAHYRTTPADLRQLLDTSDVRLFRVRLGDATVATAWVQCEGGFETALARDIYLGRRRPRGHLLAQSLACHGGLAQAPTLRGWRIVRLAVHPDCRRQGVGSALVAHIAGRAAAEVDWLGSSFGAAPGLLEFWQSCRLTLVRIGLSRDASSGEHSAQVLRGLSAAGNALCAEAVQRLQRETPHLLAGPLRDLPSHLRQWLAVDHPPVRTLDRQHWADLAGFVHGERRLEFILSAATALVETARHSALWQTLPAEERSLAEARLLEHLSEGACATRLGLTGKREVADRLRDTLRRLARDLAPDPTHLELPGT